MVATGGVLARIAIGLTTRIVAKVVTMSEQQADYDTTSDAEHMEPTPGPWEIDRSPAWEDQITSGDYTMATVHYGMAGKARANARLIAAAGTAASELPDEYDPVAAVEALPKVLKALSWALDLIDMYDEHLAEIDGEDQVYTDLHCKGKKKAKSALNAARGDSSE
jgi:hypothetical protein